MTRWWFAMASVPWLALMFVPAPRETTVLIAGDFNGYLTPCGCVKPMQGGIKRLGALIEAERAAAQSSVFFAIGPLAGPPSRQAELKFETATEALGTMKVDAIGLSRGDARLGVGSILSGQRLSGERLVASGLGAENGLSLPRSRVAGPFWVVAASAQNDQLGQSLEEPTAPWIQALRGREQRPVVLLWDGDEASARQAAQAHSAIRLVVFRSSSAAQTQPIRVGNAWIVSPGEKGKSALRLRWDGSQFVQLAALKLNPEVGEDASVQRVFAQYLRRVDRENLLEQLPRRQSDPYAGSKTCGSCHSKDYDIWKETLHAAALKTLEDDGHDRDPDCVSCHVVGLEDVRGFQSRDLTPDLADVGCESCHGPGKNHSLRPMEVKMPKIGVESCMKCHVPDHSPNFDYASYWKRIAHGGEKPVENPGKK